MKKEDTTNMKLMAKEKHKEWFPTGFFFCACWLDRDGRTGKWSGFWAQTGFKFCTTTH